MRNLLIATVISVLAIGTAVAADKKCELCGMFWDKSTTRLTATIKGDAGHTFESIGCLFQSVDAKADVSSFKINDYATGKMIDGKKAHYLYGTSRLKGSMAPFTAAFASKDAAGKAKAELGGEYVTFDDLWKKLDSSLKKKVAVKGMCACGDAKCKGCDKAKETGCSCPNCAGK